ncbi:hypothetical protein ACFFQF_17000 [Haladaptatus pallidirubidus]|uniref:Uncharacterized protein n=1 Tax=Haladaptatus pallidirubidus TaxID=1008152 RepID=A0AAV3URD7_9EURY|nr:hypothetical protein [Haladaptatus pallidirubidus]
MEQIELDTLFDGNKGCFDYDRLYSRTKRAQIEIERFILLRRATDVELGAGVVGALG